MRLSDFSTTDAVPQRYFQNRLGGLGQYYLGTLQQAGLLPGDPHSGIRYTEERGGPLARAFDGGVDRESFFATHEADESASSGQASTPCRSKGCCSPAAAPTANGSPRRSRRRSTAAVI